MVFLGHSRPHPPIALIRFQFFRQEFGPVGIERFQLRRFSRPPPDAARTGGSFNAVTHMSVQKTLDKTGNRGVIMPVGAAMHDVVETLAKQCIGTVMHADAMDFPLNL